MHAIADAHQGLPHIDDTEPFDPDRDQPLFDEIKSVLARYGALHRFGVTLLHKHFDIYQGERMVEVCDEENRSLTIRPLADSLGPDQSYVETNWRFDVKTAYANQVCMADCIKTGKTHREVHKK